MKLSWLLIVWLNVLIAPDGLATQLTVSAFAIAIASLAAKMLCAALLIVGVESALPRSAFLRVPEYLGGTFVLSFLASRDVPVLGADGDAGRLATLNPHRHVGLHATRDKSAAAITGVCGAVRSSSGGSRSRCSRARVCQHLLALGLLTIGIKGFAIPAVVRFQVRGPTYAAGARSPIRRLSDSVARRAPGLSPRRIGCRIAPARFIPICCRSPCSAWHRGDLLAYSHHAVLTTFHSIIGHRDGVRTRCALQ